MKKRFKKHFLLEIINRYSLKKKMLLLQLFCVILPLLVTDGAIITIILNTEKQSNIQKMNDMAESVSNIIVSVEDSAVSLMQDIYVNKEINSFLERSFDSPLDYYNQRLQLLRDSSYKIAVEGMGRSIITIYSGSNGTVNGGSFQKLERIYGEEWYQTFIGQDQELILFADFSNTTYEPKRHIFFVRRMNYYNKMNESILRLDLDYSDLSRRIQNAKYPNTVYICQKDIVLFSNEGKGGLYEPFETISEDILAKAGAKRTISIYSTGWDIYIMPGQNIVYEAIRNNYLLLTILILMNIIFPFLMFSLLSKSFTERLHALDTALSRVEGNGLYELPEISGSDEISMLMVTYNEMAKRLNDLIENEYINKLKQQESDLARQRAELEALHSQINPHFLFNALENIRMHSVIKNETETAQMVEKLALIHRQNVEWGNDLVTFSEETRFVEAYLELQKYRFGNKLTYEVNVDEDCKGNHIPKLSLVTFVENACVHGMEKKTSACWIFVRVSKDDRHLIMEIEDTGSGMIEEMRRKLEEDINRVDMDMLRENRRVGIMNAALRLRMMFQDHVHFEIDSEPGAGTMVSVTIDLSAIDGE